MCKTFRTLNAFLTTPLDFDDFINNFFIIFDDFVNNYGFCKNIYLRQKNDHILGISIGEQIIKTILLFCISMRVHRQHQILYHASVWHNLSKSKTIFCRVNNVLKIFLLIMDFFAYEEIFFSQRILLLKNFIFRKKCFFDFFSVQF